MTTRAIKLWRVNATSVYLQRPYQQRVSYGSKIKIEGD